MSYLSLSMENNQKWLNKINYLTKGHQIWYATHHISKAYVLRQKSYGPDTIRREEREREERKEEKLRQKTRGDIMMKAWWKRS